MGGGGWETFSGVADLSGLQPGQSPPTSWTTEQGLCIQGIVQSKGQINWSSLWAATEYSDLCRTYKQSHQRLSRLSRRKYCVLRIPKLCVLGCLSYGLRLSHSIIYYLKNNFFSLSSLSKFKAKQKTRGRDQYLSSCTPGEILTTITHKF